MDPWSLHILRTTNLEGKHGPSQNPSSGSNDGDSATIPFQNYVFSLEKKTAACLSSYLRVGSVATGYEEKVAEYFVNFIL